MSLPTISYPSYSSCDSSNTSVYRRYSCNTQRAPVLLCQHHIDSIDCNKKTCVCLGLHSGIQ